MHLHIRVLCVLLKKQVPVPSWFLDFYSEVGICYNRVIEYKINTEHIKNESEICQTSPLIPHDKHLCLSLLKGKHEFFSTTLTDIK